MSSAAARPQPQSERKPPLYTLTRARILEFVREPEALFWVFAFPIIMALVLGFAFRDRPPDPLAVGIVEGPTASSISQALEKNLGDRTAIFIAHRLSTVRHCDRIFVIAGGVVAQAGSYDELIAQTGLFQDLVRGQQLRS